MKEVTVLIPTYNKCKYLDMTLQGYMFQQYKNFEIIVVDDGSSDNTTNIVNSYKNILDIKYIYQENKGRAGARNAGLKIASGKYIIFNDDDRIPCKNFLKEHIVELKKNDKVITFGEKHELLVQYNNELILKTEDLMNFLCDNPRRLDDIINANGHRLFCKDEMHNDFDGVLKKWDLGISFDTYADILVDKGNKLENFRLAFMVPTTANLGYNRMEFPDVKFDENYKGWGVEDTDFVYQLDTMGCEYLYIPEAQNYHQRHERATDALKQLYENICYFCKKTDDIRVYLFAAIFRGIMGMTEADKIIHEIEKNPNSHFLKSYINLCKYISDK